MVIAGNNAFLSGGSIGSQDARTQQENIQKSNSLQHPSISSRKRPLGKKVHHLAQSVETHAAQK
jgi:hypothetical protein